MTDVPRLEEIAQQLIGRVRDDHPEANLRWLRERLDTDPNAPMSDVERLLFLLAAAIPDDRSWRQLTEWTRTPEEVAQQQAMRRQALINATTKPRRRHAA